jgi:D-alanyl-D-alanine dipeptidase
LQVAASIAVVFYFVGCAEPPTPAEEPAALSPPAVPEPEAAPVEAVPSAPVRVANPPPQGFVVLAEAVSGIQLSIGYHTPDNFTGAPLPGYGAPGAWMLEEAANALAKVQAELAAEDLGLLVYDAYRPLRGTAGMVAWATRTEQLELFQQGYIARRSGHNHGHTVDLTIVDSAGTPLDMGTPWDTLTEKSHTANASGQAFENRLKLKRLMSKHGFKPYSKEWWHFGYQLHDTRPRDVPYGCFEVAEGEWSPPEGWEVPEYEMPMTWPSTPCLDEAVETVTE